MWVLLAINDTPGDIQVIGKAMHPADLQTLFDLKYTYKFQPDGGPVDKDWNLDWKQINYDTNPKFPVHQGYVADFKGLLFGKPVTKLQIRKVVYG